jgi:hypothetical protein
MLLDRSVRFAQIGCFRFADFRLFIRSPLVLLDNVTKEARLILSYEVGFFYFVLQHCKDRVLGFGAHGLIGDLAVFHDNQGRDAHDAKLACQLGLFIYIDFADLDIRTLPGDFFYDGDHHTARTTPRCPEVQKDGLVGIHNFILEIVFIDIDGRHFYILLMSFMASLYLNTNCPSVMTSPKLRFFVAGYYLTHPAIDIAIPARLVQPGTERSCCQNPRGFAAAAHHDQISGHNREGKE